MRQRLAERLLCNTLAYTLKLPDYYQTGKTHKRSKKKRALDEDLPSKSLLFIFPVEYHVRILLSKTFLCIRYL